MRHSFARLICPADGRQARCIYDEDSLTICNLSLACDPHAKIEDAFVEDELNSMNRAAMVFICYMVVYRGRARKHAVQKESVTFSKHEVH